MMFHVERRFRRPPVYAPFVTQRHKGAKKKLAIFVPFF